MTADEKLAAIRDAIQTDPGNRGLAELFAYCPGDFAAACRSIAESVNAALVVFTGFYIPTAEPPAYETDGPLGAAFLKQHLEPLGIPVHIVGPLAEAIEDRPMNLRCTHEVWLEHAGPAADGNCYSMRGRDVTAHTRKWSKHRNAITIGIGDGGNEIGMGKIPHDIIVKNIPSGNRIHCRVPTDHLIVAGVSNWGAYALAAGVYVLRGVKPPADLFDPQRERDILEVMVREGPLVDGVTGRQTATVDGLSWESYIRPLVRIREILEA